MALTVLDTGIVIALGDTADVHHDATRAALLRTRDAGGSFLLPAFALAEVLVGPVRSHGEAPGRQRVQRVLELLSVRVAPLDTDIAVRAALLRAQHGKRLRLPDALVVATAAHDGASVLTTDAGWPALPGIRVIVVGRRGAPSSRSARGAT